MIQRYFKFLLMAIALVGIAMIAAITTMRLAIHGTEVQVPALAGMTMADAMHKLAAEGLNSSLADRFYSTDIPAGRVLQQTPEPGAVVRREWTVRLVESLGPQKISIPNVTGLDERTATLTIRRAGLDVGTVATLPQAGIKPGTVVAQDPQADAQGVDRPRVSILVAAEAPAASASYVMPSWVGLPVSQASVAAAGAGLHLASPQYADPQIASAGAGSAPLGARTGIIIAQHPAPGSRVSLGQTVQFTVAR